jgi:hypothetical protein
MVLALSLKENRVQPKTMPESWMSGPWYGSGTGESTSGLRGWHVSRKTRLNASDNRTIRGTTMAWLVCLLSSHLTRNSGFYLWPGESDFYVGRLGLVVVITCRFFAVAMHFSPIVDDLGGRSSVEGLLPPTARGEYHLRKEVG